MKILITPRSFGKNNPNLFTQLENKGLEIIKNDTGGILTEEKICQMIKDCSGIILGVDPMNKNVLSKAPKLKTIAKYGVGTDNIDLEFCKEHNIKVSKTIGANSNAVADYAFAMMLAVARKITVIDKACRNKDWSKVTSIDIYGKKLGIIGLGAVGKCLAKRAKGFDMQILAHDIFWDNDFASQYCIQKVDIDTIFKEADVISLHTNLTDETRNLVNKKRLNYMKKTAILINTARGELVDESALLEALIENQIFGAGIDVFTKEPPEDPRWFELNNIILGSHTSSSTIQATNDMGQMAVNNLLNDLGIS